MTEIPRQLDVQKAVRLDLIGKIDVSLNGRDVTDAGVTAFDLDAGWIDFLNWSGTGRPVLVDGELVPMRGFGDVEVTARNWSCRAEVTA